MNLKKLIASTAVALTLAALPALADDSDMNKSKSHGDLGHRDSARYTFNIEPGEQMIFRDPVSFTGKVIEETSYNRTLEASNGMVIKVPNQALLWNGDRSMFAQGAAVGDEVVVHLRPEEPYRIMKSPSVDWIAVGSYDGVFYLSEDFIKDIDFEELDNNIYSDKSNKTYDEDFESAGK